MAISADGTQIKVNGKMFTLSDDADTREKQLDKYKRYALSPEIENQLNSIPIPQKKYKISTELIEKRYQQCRKQEDEAVADGEKTTPNYELCEKFKKRLYDENEIKDQHEAAETSKTSTPDPVSVSKKSHILNVQKTSKANHAEVLTKVAEDLIPIESSIKAGGNQIISYEKDKHESVGSVVNTFPHIRKDTSGEFRPKIISIEGKGSFVNYSPVSYTEEVENSRFPCGTYSLNVGNKYDLSVGAGGANISTVGNMRVGSGAFDVQIEDDYVWYNAFGNIEVDLDNIA